MYYLVMVNNYIVNMSMALIKRNVCVLCYRGWLRHCMVLNVLLFIISFPSNY